MKFKDLEEGKKYSFVKNQAIEYIIKDKLLWSVNDDCYSCLSASDISELEFKEIPQYVTFEEAIKHMRKGGLAQIDELITQISYDGYLYKSDSCVKIDFNIKLLNSKWILL